MLTGVSTPLIVGVIWLGLSFLFGAWLYIAQVVRERRHPLDGHMERRYGARDRRGPHIPRPPELERRRGPRDRRHLGAPIPH
jgi:hypothetical protein